MSATTALIRVETKLQFRDLGVVAFGLLFPTMLLVVLGFAFPGFRDPQPDLGGGRLIDLYTPIVLVLVLVVVGVSTIASALATYRHDGVLRRLRTTPVGPGRLLVAQLVAQVAVATLGLGLATAAALTLLDVPGPRSWVGVVVALLCTAAAMFAIGLLIGATVPSAATAQGVSTATWLPLMVLAGLWFPREGMPEAMRRISDLSPGGAAVDAVQRAWFGGEFAVVSLLVLVAFAVVVGAIAALTFRWE
jgi:ABC-2 type transport system permease protein